MKLIIVRHGDPNYAIDSLTMKGRREAKLLVKKLVGLNADYFYCSPLGRAKKTASFTMKALKKKYEIKPWLTEFEGRVTEPDGRVEVCWDRLPSYWTNEDAYYTDKWYETPLMKEHDVKAKYDAVCNGLDELLAKHGYVHEGRHFNAVRSNHDTIILFCHFGVESVLLAHLLGVSPMVFWHNFVALPTSITTVVTEEREKGFATFRITSFGDTGHLYSGGEEPSFKARFCECFDDDTRH